MNSIFIRNYYISRCNIISLKTDSIEKNYDVFFNNCLKYIPKMLTYIKLISLD